MKEIPILFNGEMVRAILEGRKTQTRRPMNPQPVQYIDELHGGDFRGRAPYNCFCNETGHLLGVGYQDDNEQFYKCPFGCIGDRLWVRETFCVGYKDEDGDMSCLVPTGESEQIANRMVKYKASHEMPKHSAFKWTPSIHMPRWASRITLEVTDIRVQRVQEISDEDTAAEGITRIARNVYEHGRLDGYGVEGCDPAEACTTRVNAFRKLWKSIYNTWDANPWVWVATFKKVEAAQ